MKNKLDDLDFTSMNSYFFYKKKTQWHEESFKKYIVKNMEKKEIIRRGFNVIL